MMCIFPSSQLPGSCTCKHLNFLLAQSVCMASDIWLTGTWRNGIRSKCCSYHSIIFIKRLKHSQMGDHLTNKVFTELIEDPRYEKESKVLLNSLWLTRNPETLP
ncbi:uncharacterized protein ACIB01_011152 [Guaruba guarouba]